MAIMNSVRKLFARRRPMDLSISQQQDLQGESVDLVIAGEHTHDIQGQDGGENAQGEHKDVPATIQQDEQNQPLAVLGRIEQAIEESRSSGSALVESAQRLPEVARSLSSLGESQRELVELTRSLQESQKASNEIQQAMSDRLCESFDRQSETLGLVQRQLDANHQIAAQTAQNLTSISEGLTESMNASRRTAEAMSTLVGEMRSREARTAERFSRLQGWMLGCTIAAIGVIVAAVTLAWVVFSGSTGS